jgi:hypothetical protein
VWLNVVWLNVGASVPLVLKLHWRFQHGMTPAPTLAVKVFTIKQPLAKMR